MKNWINAAFVCLFAAIILASCSKAKETQAADAPNQTSPAKIDFDLSSMNYNMISSITFEMLVEPEKYAEKSVKISGEFYSEVYEGIRYYSVIVWDATQCCPAGLDFIPPENLEFPNDFPQEGQKITVTGKMKEDSQSGELVYIASAIELS